MGDCLEEILSSSTDHCYLTIVPSWEQYETTDPAEKIITLDPGMAFGTGTHPTTRLTLQALEMYLRGEETVLDVGTGSGF